MMLRPFDYVEDAAGWIFVVRGVVDNPCYFFATPIYVPSNSGFLKVKTCRDIPACTPRPQLSSCETVGSNIFYGSQDDIIQAFRPSEDTSGCLNTAPAHIHHIALLAKKSGYLPHLFGSRLLGIESSGSDWDLLFIGDGNPRDFVTSIVAAADFPFRFFNKSEIARRVERYWRAGTSSDSEKILSRTTLYLKHNGDEVGLFFTTMREHSVPNLVKILGSRTTRIHGTIVASGGSSYRMPRKFIVRQCNGKEICVMTFCWELGGIEEFGGHSISIREAFCIDSSHAWFSGEGEEISVQL